MHVSFAVEGLLWAVPELPSTSRRWQKTPVTKDLRQEQAGHCPQEYCNRKKKKRVPWGIRRPWQRLHSEDFTYWDTRGHPTSLRIQSSCFSLHRLKFNLATQTWPCSVCHLRWLKYQLVLKGCPVTLKAFSDCTAHPSSRIQPHLYSGLTGWPQTENAHLSGSWTTLPIEI